MFTVREILQATRGRMQNPRVAGRFRDIVIDSRACKKGDLFIAIKGERYDGHDYLRQAIDNGATGVVVSKTAGALAKLPAAVIVVPDTIRALGALAGFHRQRFTLPVVAITGSAGKTSTKELIAAVLGTQIKVLKNDASFNNHIGVPLTLLKLKASYDVAVIELGTNQPGDIAYLARMVRPKIALFTNIGPSHLKGLKNCAGIFQEKTQLLKYLDKRGTIIFNQDDAYLKKLPARKMSYKMVPFSIKDVSLNQACVLRFDSRGGAFRVNGKIYTFSAITEAHIYNAVAAICCGNIFGIFYTNIKKGLKKARPAKGRLQIIPKGGGIVLDDTYNANPLSLQAAIEALKNISVKGKKIFVLGDMLELGRAAQRSHRKAAEVFLNHHIDVLLTFGRVSAVLAQALKQNKEILVYHYQRMPDLLRRLDKIWEPHDAICVKGSHAMRMERVVLHLKERMPII